MADIEINVVPTKIPFKDANQRKNSTLTESHELYSCSSVTNPNSTLINSSSDGAIEKTEYLPEATASRNNKINSLKRFLFIFF